MSLHLLARLFASLIMVILILATVVSMAVGDVIFGGIILAIIFPSGLLGYFQERRAGRIMEELLRRIQVRVELIRGGQEVNITEDEVVLGDLLSLHVGDIIPADCVIELSDGLLVDESALRGESFPREKLAGVRHLGYPITERSTELFASKLDLRRSRLSLEC